MTERKTLADIADHSAENIARAQAAREDRRIANKAIHAAGGAQIAVWDEVAAGATVVSIAKGAGAIAVHLQQVALFHS